MPPLMPRGGCGKKEQGQSPAPKIVSTLLPRNFRFDFDCRGDAACARRAPPETWTTRPQPCGRPEAPLVDHLFRLVINFSNDCLKFEHGAKSSGLSLPAVAPGDARTRAGVKW